MVLANRGTSSDIRYVFFCHHNENMYFVGIIRESWWFYKCFGCKQILIYKNEKMMMIVFIFSGSVVYNEKMKIILFK